MILSPQKEYWPSKKPPMAIRLKDKPTDTLSRDELRFVIIVSYIAGFTGGMTSIAALTWWLM
jgi:hypothetical protein